MFANSVKKNRVNAQVIQIVLFKNNDTKISAIKRRFWYIVLDFVILY